MLRTCTIQVNLDYSAQIDMVRKFKTATTLQPIITALFCNSPFYEGRPSGFLSMRTEVWRNTDNARSGIPVCLFEEDFGYEKWVDYLLSVPMYFVHRDGKYYDVSGSSFQNFLNGKLKNFEGQHPTVKDWEDHIQVNLLGGVKLSRHFLPKMIKKNWGRIIFVSSECATLVPGDLLSYSVSKASVNVFSCGLAKLTKGTKVTVNTIIPGSTLSEGSKTFLEETAKRENKTIEEVESNFFKDVRPSSLLGRFAKVEEVASTIVYISSPLASATNGASVRVDGGSMGSVF